VLAKKPRNRGQPRLRGPHPRHFFPFGQSLGFRFTVVLRLLVAWPTQGKNAETYSASFPGPSSHDGNLCAAVVYLSRAHPPHHKLERQYTLPTVPPSPTPSPPCTTTYYPPLPSTIMFDFLTGFLLGIIFTIGMTVFGIYKLLLRQGGEEERGHHQRLPHYPSLSQAQFSRYIKHAIPKHTVDETEVVCEWVGGYGRMRWELRMRMRWVLKVI
jgi:hypothetical protein